MSQNKSPPPQPDKLDSRYIKLDPDFAAPLTWSNNPRDLDLYVTFSEKEPNLSSDFRVKGLKPILKDMDDDESFILKDDEGFYYLWNLWEGNLLRVADEWTKDEALDGSIEDIVQNIIMHYTWVKREAKRVVKDYETGSYKLV